MKIAMLGHKQIPSREGGVEVVVEELATRMVSLGNSVTVFNRQNHTSLGSQHRTPSAADRHNYKGVTLRSVPTIQARGLAALSSSFMATIAAIKMKPDVIHFHAEGPCAMINVAKKAGIRTVATIHGLDWQRAKWGNFASWYLKVGEKIAAKYADEIIVLSKNVQTYFRQTYSRETHYVPNGIGRLEKVKANAIEKEYGLTKDSYILFIGRIVPEKGLHYLINAYKGIETEKRLVIVGHAHDSQKYFNEVKRLANDDSRILFAGFAAGQKLAEFYSNAYLYVLPSDLEGMPMSLLEAMAYGNCCLTSNIPECTEVIGDCGFSFSKGSAENLKSLLQILLGNQETVIEIQNRSPLFVAAEYEWEKIVNETLALYDANITTQSPKKENLQQLPLHSGKND